MRQQLPPGLTASPRTAGRRGRTRDLDPRSPRPSMLLSAFFAPAICLLIAAAGAGVAYTFSGRSWLHWLALHLALLGGVSQLVLGAGQFFVCAFLATDPPPRRWIWSQLATWNGGVLLVAIGVPTSTSSLVDLGGALIVLGLALFAGALYGMQRRSLQRARWAVRWYQACAACLGLGALIGILLARGTAWSHGSLLGAHLALNLGGWLGTAIVGTLHTFFPSLTGTRLRYLRLQGPTFVLWVAGVLALGIGAGLNADALLGLGWLWLMLAAWLLSINLVASLRGGTQPLSLPARLITSAHVFLPIALLLALATTIADGGAAPFQGATRSALAVLLLAGWIGLTVSGALLHLLAVLARVRNFSRPLPEANAARDRALAACAGLGIATLAISHLRGLSALTTPATAVMLPIAALLMTRVLMLALRTVRAPQGGAL